MTELLAGLSRAGGAPPPSRESLRVFADGTVEAVVATAWPGDPADAAGRFALLLDGERLAELERLVHASSVRGSDDAARPDSGRVVVTLPGERRIELSPFAQPDALLQRLDELRLEAREHPLAAVRLNVSGPETVHAGEAVELSFVVEAVGTSPIAVTVEALRARLVAGTGTEPPPVLWAREAKPLPGGGAVDLAPGERWTAAALVTDVPSEPGPYRVDGFAEVGIDQDRAVLTAGPVAIVAT